MQLRFVHYAPICAAVFGVVIPSFFTSTAQAEEFRPIILNVDPNAPAPCPIPAWPAAPCPTPGVTPIPGTIADPKKDTSQQPQPQSPTPSNPLSDSQAFAGGGDAPRPDAGYIDNAVPTTMFRLRFDSAYDANRPDRAAFLYARCGFGGPPNASNNVNYQNLNAYFEMAFSNRWSGFVELPTRYVQPQGDASASGLSDVNFGFKYAMIADPDRYVTFQYRTYCPSGDASAGLGTRHFTAEPGILLYQQLGQRWSVQAEVLDWIPFGGDGSAGNVLTYGAGMSYLAYNSDPLRVSPVAELVGWQVLGGTETVLNGTTATSVSAAGDSILNLKIGLRIGLGETTPTGNRNDLYIGYGRALTGDFWYKDLFRIEYRMRF